MRAGGAPASTCELRRYYVRRLAAVHPELLAVDVDDLAGWLGCSGWSPNTMKSARSAVRCFYGWAVATGRLGVSPAHLLPAVRVPRGRPKPTPDRTYRRALLTGSPREQLAVRLAGQCGLRRGEVARVRGTDVESDLIGYSLRVVGKGGHVRVVPLPDDLGEQLAALGDGWAFPSPRGGHLTPHHLGKAGYVQIPDDAIRAAMRAAAA